MNRNNKLSQQFVARILLISLFLQSCSTSINLPNQGENGEECKPVRKKHKVGEKKEEEKIYRTREVRDASHRVIARNIDICKC